MAKANFENSKKTQTMALEANTLSKNSEHSMLNLENSMGKIVKGSENVSEIIKIIEELANKTNKSLKANACIYK